jgi:hypothetical protein
LLVQTCLGLCSILAVLLLIREVKDDEDEKRSEKDELETPEKKCAVVLGRCCTVLVLLLTEHAWVCVAQGASREDPRGDHFH